MQRFPLVVWCSISLLALGGLATLACQQAPEPPPPPPSAEEVLQALQEGLRASGDAVAESHTEDLGMSRQTYQVWNLDLRTENRSPYPVVFGDDLLLFESDAAGGTFEGVRVSVELDNAADSDHHTFYSLSNSERREKDGRKVVHRGGRFTITSTSDEDEGRIPTFGSLQPGESRTWEEELEMGVWLKEEHRASLRVVLPELTVDRGDEEPLRLRWLLYFRQPGPEETAWGLDRQEVIRLEPEGLEPLLTIPETNLVTRILAANWLADVDPVRAGPALARVARGLPDGDLLAACLSHLAHLESEGAEEHSMELLAKKDGPNGIRRLSAAYLGAVGYEPARELLIETAAEKERIVAVAAIQGLAGYPGPEGSAILLDMAKGSVGRRHLQAVLQSLARTRHPDAQTYLAERARGKDKKALDALIREGAPASFDLFLELGNAEGRTGDRGQLARGLVRSDPERASEPLYGWLQEERLANRDKPLGTSTLVDQLAGLDQPELVPRLAQGARDGHLPSLQVLARSRHDSAREPLTASARSAEGPAQLIGLDGLSRHWPEGNEDLFKKALETPTRESVRIAVRGLRASAPEELPGLLLPVLEDDDSGVRRTAADSLAACDLEPLGDEVVRATLATSDDQVAVRLVSGLLDQGWKDRATLPLLLEGLDKEDEDLQFQIVRLLRGLSDEAMGPEGYGEFTLDAARWVNDWREWVKAELSRAEPDAVGSG